MITSIPAAEKPPPGTAKRDQQPAFWKATVQFGGLTLTPGIRYDHYQADMLGDQDQTFTEFSKAFGAEYRFESGFGLFANYTELAPRAGYHRVNPRELQRI